MRKLEQALGSGAAVACAALLLCACGDEPFHEYMEMLPPCADGRHALLEDVNIERDTDYIGDYEGGRLLESIGTACEGAPHVDRCTNALEAALSTIVGQRALVTIEGDAVRVWNAEGASALFGPIDAPSEALYVTLLSGYSLDCDSTVTRIADGYRVSVIGVGDPCNGGVAVTGSVEIYSDGQVADFAPGANNRSPCTDRRDTMMGVRP